MGSTRVKGEGARGTLITRPDQNWTDGRWQDLPTLCADTGPVLDNDPPTLVSFGTAGDGDVPGRTRIVVGHPRDDADRPTDSLAGETVWTINEFRVGLERQAVVVHGLEDVSLPRP